MPIYEYVCSDCGEEFEAIQKFSDKPLTRCACGKSGKVERKLSLSAFQLKGGGWYKDQYGRSASGGGDSKSNGDSGGKDSASPSAGAAAEGAKASGESKTAGGAESGSKPKGSEGNSKSSESGSGSKAGESGSSRKSGGSEGSKPTPAGGSAG